MRAPKVRCERCNGHGVRDVGFAHLETWKFLTFKWRTTIDIGKSLPLVKHTALCNRLKDMERIGVVRSRRSPTNSKTLEWRRS